MIVVIGEIEMIKICQECGKEFEATNGMQKFCNATHFRTCVVCGKQFEVTRYHLTAKDARTTCSKECSALLRKQTNIVKYGGAAPSCSSEVREKMETTTLARYGVKHAAQAKMFIDKSEQTSLARYGKRHYAQTTKSRKQLSDRWADPEYKNKVIANRVSTNIERYGFKNPMQSLDVKMRSVAAKIADPSKSGAYLEFKADPRNFITNLNLDHKPTIQELSKLLGTTDSTVGVFIHVNDCDDMIVHHVSTMEQEVIDFLHELDPDMIINHRDRTVIPPYEIDIYLPEYKLGIECNPTATHNSDINVFSRESKPMSSSYHQMKTNICEENGVRLIHIFGYEWQHKKSIIESILANALHMNANRIYARKCELKEVTSAESSTFLIANHRQGNVNSSVRLGLFYEGELVSLMTFSKMRSTIGSPGEGYELVRFCSKLKTSVVGGATKLFSYFVNQYRPQYIRSFSDRAHTSGRLYGTLGFHERCRSAPGYCWVSMKDDVAYHRINAQKQNIKRFLSDDSVDLTKSEREIMVEHDFVRVFDSGTITWEWHPDTVVSGKIIGA